MRKIHCPICRKICISEESSYIKQYYAELEQFILNHPEDNGEKEVFCRECENKSIVKYHSVGNRCKNCYSFNTYLNN